MKKLAKKRYWQFVRLSLTLLILVSLLFNTEAFATNAPALFNSHDVFDASTPSFEKATSVFSSSNMILLAVLLFTAIALCILILLYYKKVRALQVELKVAQKRLQEARSANETLHKKFLSEMQDVKADAKKQIDSARKPYEDKIAYLRQVHDQTAATLREQIGEQAHELATLSDRYAELSQQFETLTDRYQRACLLYPNLDDGVSEMIATEIRLQNKQSAKKFDDSIATLICKSANKDLVDDFSYALDTYSSLAPEVQAFVTSNIGHLQDLYQESQKIKEEHEEFLRQEQIRIQNEKDKSTALATQEEISSIISSTGESGTSESLDSLKRAVRIYENLNANARSYFDSSIISKAKHLLREAQEDFDQQQERARNKAKAEEAMRTISSIVSSIHHASEHDLNRLISARRAYEKLSYQARPYFDLTLINNLEQLIKQAQEEHEESERRRKKQLESEARVRRQREEEARRSSSSGTRGGGFGEGHSGSGGLNKSRGGGFGGGRSGSGGLNKSRSGGFGGGRSGSGGLNKSRSGGFGGGRSGSGGLGGSSRGGGSSKKF